MLLQSCSQKFIDVSCCRSDRFAIAVWNVMRIWICHVNVTALRQNILSFAMLQFDSVNTEQTATLSHTSQLHADKIVDRPGCGWGVWHTLPGRQHSSLAPRTTGASPCLTLLCLLVFGFVFVFALLLCTVVLLKLLYLVRAACNVHIGLGSQASS